MAKKFSSRSKSTKSSKNIKFDFIPNSIIFEKTNIDNNSKNTIIFDVKPQKINSPTIENTLKYKR